MDGAPYESHAGTFGWDPLIGAADVLADPGDGPGGAASDRDESFAAIEPLAAPELLGQARRMAAARAIRDRMFGRDLFPNPAWNILLELFIAGEEGRNVTIKSACVAAGVPQSTALRHIAHLIDVRLAARHQHPSDARSAYLKLSDRGRSRMVAFISLSAADPRGRDA